MVMQWTVNPPPSGTPGSIPGYSTNLYLGSVMAARQSPKLFVGVRVPPWMPIYRSVAESGLLQRS